ncbi:chloramphenicol resistance protein [Xenorhabdus budapestensis]|uniref:Bcr/CflA family efflux transporter n=1 Tax=Xenorhabdus budapestensis TaxID=290110 RepID=A0A2D0J3G6_XENBU|nr:chloramphenicol resistance protein [Xenorhabdus budapestensis]
MHSKNFLWQYSFTTTVLLLSPFSLLPSLAMDMYLPVMPIITDALGAGAGTIQLTLTIYMVMLGIGQLLFGPLSDRFGRRPVLLSGGIGFTVASLGLAITSSSEIFLGLRIIQACGASACLVAMFATVRDIYSGRKEINVIYGILGSMLAMVPAIAPLFGTLLDIWLGWRAIFCFLGFAMAVTVIVIWKLCPETGQKGMTELQWDQLILPVKSLNVWLYTFCYSAGLGSFFVFFSTAPWVMMNRQELSQTTFSLLFATVAIAMMMTARNMGSLITHWGILGTLRIAMFCLIAGALLLSVGETLIPKSVFGFIVPMWLLGVGVAMAVSVAPNGALQGFDHMAGTVTAFYSCLGSLLLGMGGTFTITLLSNATTWPIIAYSLVLATVVLCLSFFIKSENLEQSNQRY